MKSGGNAVPRPLVAAIVGVLLLDLFAMAAHSDDGSSPSKGPAIAMSPAGDTGETGDGSATTVPNGVPSSAPATGSAGGTATTTAATASKGSSKPPPYKYDLVVEPKCVSAGGTVSVTANMGIPQASLLLIVGYVDGYRNTWHVGTADAEGRATYTFIVPPDAPTGDALVSTSGGDKANPERQARTSATFRVAKPGGCK